MLAWISHRLRSLGHSESGIALPVTIFAMIGSMGLAGAAVVATVDVQQGSHRDSSAKAAIAAADAGANVARMRQTRYGYLLNASNPCLLMGSDGKLQRGPAVDEGGQRVWCPEISGTVGGSSYAYRVSAVGLNCGTYELCVVSTGTADDVSRRIEVTYKRDGWGSNATEQTSRETRKQKLQEDKELIEAEIRDEQDRVDELKEKQKKEAEEKAKAAGAEGFIGRDGITLSGNADIRVGVGTNGNLVSSGNASICGSVRHGVGKKWSKSGNASQCSGYQVTEGNVELPPVSSFMPLDIATNNSNNRITRCTSTNVPVGCQKDSFTGNWKSKPPFDPKTRQISLSANDTLTVGGGDYWICGISFSGNSQLIMADGARVRFFFDAPERCAYNGNQLNLSGNNRIAATGYQPSDGQFEMPGFYFLGSPTIETQINLSGNYSTTNEMIVYGPDTYINISGNATFKGVIAGKLISMSGNGKVEQDAGFELPPELNPGNPGDDGDDGNDGNEGGGESIVELEERLEEVIKEISDFDTTETTRTNTVAITYTPQAYFECSGLAPVNGAPNVNC